MAVSPIFVGQVRPHVDTFGRGSLSFAAPGCSHQHQAADCTKTNQEEASPNPTRDWRPDISTCAMQPLR